MGEGLPRGWRIRIQISCSPIDQRFVPGGVRNQACCVPGSPEDKILKAPKTASPGTTSTPPRSSTSPRSSEEGTPHKVSRTFTRKPGPESGPDCLPCAEFARKRSVCCCTLSNTPTYAVHSACCFHGLPPAPPSHTVHLSH